MMCALQLESSQRAFALFAVRTVTHSIQLVFFCQGTRFRRGITTILEKAFYTTLYSDILESAGRVMEKHMLVKYADAQHSPRVSKLSHVFVSSAIER